MDLEISETFDDPAWDKFVDLTAGSHYSQKTLWAQVKAVEGWQALRIIVREGERIKAGVQLLYRPNRPLGWIGYAPFGILNPEGDIRIDDEIFNRLKKICNLKNILYLTIPYWSGEGNNHLNLEDYGFQLGAIGDIDSPGTNHADLTLDAEEIIQRMDKNKRSQVRSSQKRGLLFREGVRDEISTFYQLHAVDAKRIGYPLEGIEFFFRLWDVFEPHGYLKLFFTEDEGKIINGLVVVLHQDRAFDYKIGWSGEEHLKYPNEAIRWGSMMWAKEHGFRFYDFGGLEGWAIEAIQKGKPYPERFIHSYACFKYRMGSNLTLYPPLYDYVPNPLINWVYRKIGPPLMESPKFRRLIRYNKDSGKEAIDEQSLRPE